MVIGVYDIVLNTIGLHWNALKCLDFAQVATEYLRWMVDLTRYYQRSKSDDLLIIIYEIFYFTEN